MLFWLSAVALAARNLVDVPVKDWAHEAIGKLGRAGLIAGYDDGAFKGEKTSPVMKLMIW